MCIRLDIERISVILYILYGIIIPPKNGKFQFRIKPRMLPTTNKCILIERQPCNCFFVLNITKKSLISDLGKALNVTEIYKCVLDWLAGHAVFACHR